MNAIWTRRLRAICSWYLYPWASLVVRCRRPYVIGVTGSVGKTTTKEMIAAVLETEEARTRVGLMWKTQGNMNCNFGIPLTLLGFFHWPATNMQAVRWMLVAPFRALALATFSRYPRVLVLEYAAAWACDVGRNAKLVRPHIAVVTAVGPAHLERFGTVERLVEEKSALVRSVAPTGLVVLGSDNDAAARMERCALAPVVKVPGRGRELSENIARTVAGRLGVAEESTARAIAAHPGYPGRLVVVSRPTLTIINDWFNANPLSMKLGLDTLATVGAAHQRKVAILGTMGELGADASRYHREIADYAHERASLVIGVGDLAQQYRPDRWYASSEDCVNDLAQIVRPGDCVLVKGSHSAHLNTVAAHLERLAKASGP